MKVNGANAVIRENLQPVLCLQTSKGVWEPAGRVPYLYLKQLTMYFEQNETGKSSGVFPGAWGLLEDARSVQESQALCNVASGLAAWCTGLVEHSKGPFPEHLYTLVLENFYLVMAKIRGKEYRGPLPGIRLVETPVIIVSVYKRKFGWILQLKPKLSKTL